MRFSVIIPVYNAESTICQCLDSLLSQHYSDAEILLINDGSTDGSSKICADYADRFSQVRLIEKANEGVSSARNAGLDSAEGDYVVFVDSDDYVSSDFFRQIETALSEQSWDWIRFAFAPSQHPADRISQSSQHVYLTRADLFPRIIDDICNKAINSPCAKVYRRELLERGNLRFPLGASVAEDRALNIRYSMYIQNYLVSDRVIYYVNTSNHQSLSRKRHQDLDAQFAVTGNYVEAAIRDAKLPGAEKDLYRRAYQFGVCRSIYREAKDLHRDRVAWFQRQKSLFDKCKTINRMHMHYPGTFYCRVITLPVRFYQTWLIDLIAKHLLKS